MKRKALIIVIFIQIVITGLTLAHPGSGIVVDELGQIYFTDTGKGIWKIDMAGKLIYIPASRFHWMTIDKSGSFLNSSRMFGGYFEKVSHQKGSSLIMCSDFPLVSGPDGNIYYVNTRSNVRAIVKRTSSGNESVIATNAVFEHAGGIAWSPDGSLIITDASSPGVNTIRKINMNGAVSTIATFIGKNAIDLPLETVPSYCRGLAADSSGNIFVAATGSRAVLKVNAKGKITTILTEPCPWTPTAVAVFRGSVYILEWHDVAEKDLEVRTAYIPRVRKIAPDGKVSTIATVTR
jgi:hypothetical protein